MDWRCDRLDERLKVNHNYWVRMKFPFFFSLKAFCQIYITVNQKSFLFIGKQSRRIDQPNHHFSSGRSTFNSDSPWKAQLKSPIIMVPIIFFHFFYYEFNGCLFFPLVFIIKQRLQYVWWDWKCKIFTWFMKA